jgi:porin
MRIANTLGRVCRSCVVVAAAIATSGLGRPAGAAPAPSPDSLGPKLTFSGAWAHDAHRVLSPSAGEGSPSQHYFLLAFDAQDRVRDGLDVEAFVSFMDHGGLGVRGRSGDIQGISNIEALPSQRLYEAWAQATLGDGAASVLVGLYDLNRDFYSIRASKLFLNASHGIGPEIGLSGLAGPSIYPNTSLALRAQVRAAEGVLFRFAVLDGVPGAPGHPGSFAIHLGADDGALLVGEADVIPGGSGPLRVAAGVWAYTARFDGARGIRGSGSRGAYVFTEGELAGCEGDGPCLRAFLRAGHAAPDFNPISNSLGAGVTLEGGPRGSSVGVAWAMAHTGMVFDGATGYPHGTEGNLEITARVPIIPGVEILPDLQIIRAPGMDPTSPRVAVASVRLALGF